MCQCLCVFFVFKQKTAYEMRISDWSSDVCSSDLFRRDHPEDFRLLAETEIPFYWEHEGFDIRARQRVIELDRFGAVSGVTISQHLADVFDLPQHLLDDYYPALRRFGRLQIGRAHV